MVSYSGRRILVTGGTGFIGSRLVEKLTLEGHDKVRVLVHNWPKATWVSRTNAELFQGEITDRKTVEQAIKGCDLVFHCVGVGGSRETCMEVNVSGTRNLLSCAADADVERVIYLSSVAVHGPNPPDNANEQDEFRSTGAPYGDSKIAAEEIVWQFAQQKGLPIVVIRPTFVWGPLSASFTLWPILCMKEDRWFLVDEGKGTCNAIYVDNLIDSLFLAGYRKEALGEAFLITNGQPCTWAEFFGYYARMLGKDRLPSVSSTSLPVRVLQGPLRLTDNLLDFLSNTPIHNPTRTFARGTRFGLRLMRHALSRFVPYDVWDIAKYARIGRLDISKARSVLGYRPLVTLEEGMRQTEIWLRDQRIL